MENLFAIIFTAGMLRHSYTDLREMLLYDSLNLCLLAAALLRAAYYGNFRSALAGGLLLLGIMLALYCASRGGMGEGDVKLAGVLGLWLGMERGLVCLLLAFTGGACVGGLLLLCGKCSRRQALPFGPFLCGGGLLAYIWGTRILAWYKQFL